MSQNISAILAETPVRLLQRPLSDFTEVLREPDLPPELLSKIDYALRHQVVRALSRTPEPADLETVYDGLRRLIPVEREDLLATEMKRWRAFADLVDTRLGMLDSLEPDTARRLLHADRILDFVAKHPGCSQTQIAAELELKAANFTRILGILEANELIERQAIGKEKRVHLGRLERQRRAEEYPAGPIDHGHEVAEKPAPRFADYLCLAA